MMTFNLSAPTTPRIRVNLFKTQQSHLVPSVQAQGRRRSAITIIRLTVAQLPEPNVPKIQLNQVKKRLLEVIPEPVKQVPWENAEKIFLNNLLDAGEKALKLIFIPLFILSSMGDVIFSISRNKELLIPIGLFVGCTLSDFLNEAYQELFHESEQRTGSSRQLLYIGSFFLLTRIVSSSLSLSASVLFMHIANGGLMQVLWLWRNSQEASRNNYIEEASVLSQDMS